MPSLLGLHVNTACGNEAGHAARILDLASCDLVGKSIIVNDGNEYTTGTRPCLHDRLGSWDDLGVRRRLPCR